MIKKFISCILCFCLFPLAAFAGVNTPISINSETKAFDITGTSSVKNGEVLVIVTKPNVNISTLAPEHISSSAATVYVLETSSDGNYAGQFYLPDGAPSGDYNVYVGSDGFATFYYADAEEIDKCIQAIKTADISNIGSRLHYYTQTQKILGLDLGGDYAAYSDAANFVMIDYITLLAPTSIATIQDYFTKSTQAGVFVRSTDSNKLKALIADNDLELTVGADISADNLVNMYLSLRDSSVTTVAGIASTLRLAEALCKINSSTRGVMDSVLTKYNDVLQLNLDGDYATLDKVEVNKALERKNFTSAIAVRNAFSASVLAVKGLANQNTVTQTPGKVSSTINVSGNNGSSGNSSGVVAPEQPPLASAFNDLDDAIWAEGYINALAAKNIINGVGDGRFDPNGTVTREQYVKMLLGAFNIGTSGTKTLFDDVDSSMWYAPYISAAYENGIVSGVSESLFGIGTPITREQMAVMSVRTMEKYGIHLNNYSSLSFVDRAEISAYAYDAVGRLTASGIINGISSSEFAPKDVLTRAQAAKVIYMIMKEGGYID